MDGIDLNADVDSENDDEEEESLKQSTSKWRPVQESGFKE